VVLQLADVFDELVYLESIHLKEGHSLRALFQNRFEVLQRILQYKLAMQHLVGLFKKIDPRTSAHDSGIVNALEMGLQ
jgi:hypothetical protein